jgi:hypothetical protein
MISELSLKIKEIDVDASFIGFVSLLKSFYELYSSHINKELEKFIAVLQAICSRSLGAPVFEEL